MCGFVGMVFREASTQVDTDRLRDARETLIHRGPDEAGLWQTLGVGLAHRRLKVIDLVHGQQPIVDDQRQTAMVYNGEIYNFADIKKNYAQKGHTFKTQCDTEAVFHAINQDGINAIEQFNGMFAIGHWNQTNRKLLLIRDRLGQKPLYWYSDDRCFAFASEIKALLVLLNRKFDLDLIATDQYFTRGYILSPRTIFKQINKLAAGEQLTLDAKKWQWQTKTYWDFQPQNVPTDPQKALDELDDLLYDSVRKRLVSDVPIGCLLSGGIDSTLITAMAAKALDRPVEAFTIGFTEDAHFNELPYAEMVAKKHGCNWHHRSAQVDNFIKLVDDVSDYYDEPFANIAIFPMRTLAQMAREKLVVVLSGQGGDELSAGYQGRYVWATQPAQKGTSPHGIDDLHAYLQHTTLIPWHPGRDVMFSSDIQNTLMQAMKPMDHVSPFWQKHPQLDRLNNTLYADVKTNLPDYLVCVEERMTMAASLEARNPMLDHRVVNFLLSLDTSLKVKDGQYKWILLELAKRYGPIEAIDRPKKGFTPPLGQWITTLGEPIAQIFQATQKQTAGLYAPDWQKYLLQGQYQQGTVMGVLYSLMFAKWIEKFGQYINHWPTPKKVSLNRGSRWHQALNLNNEAFLAEGRILQQVLKQFAPNAALSIQCDEPSWYHWFIKFTKHPIVQAPKGDAHVVIGEKQATQWASQTPETSTTGQTLFILPFENTQSQSIQTLIQTIGNQAPLKQHQAIPVDQANTVLILLCQTIPTTPTTSATN